VAVVPSIVFTEAPITLASSKIEIPAASASVANEWRS
jgi:uroporphyrinogen-III decarboxylase